MYTLSTSLSQVKGIGPTLYQQLTEHGFETVRDLMLCLPLRYEDRSHFTLIADAPRGELVTIKAYVVNSKNYYKGRRSIQSATLSDETGKLKVMWFNNPHIIAKATAGKTLLFSGKINDKGFLLQPLVEAVSDDTIHTGRIVPVYSASIGLKIGTLRRILKHILDEVTLPADPLAGVALAELHLATLKEAINHIHFPEDENSTAQAMQRLALEELLGLIQTSQQIKSEWQTVHTSTRVTVSDVWPALPFALTAAQQRCTKEILSDMQQDVPMNRLLLGDVGSGKTAVAGIAAYFAVKSGSNAALIVPTQILAGQHSQTLLKLFPDIEIEVITGKIKSAARSDQQSGGAKRGGEAKLYVGTHAVINRLPELKPALVVYDEQHRFGVKQRSEAQYLENHPHILTMSATPIPRSLMLSIFSHLQLSVIDELPAGRQPTKTWVTPESKRADSYRWLAEQLSSEPGANQAIIVCPFIQQSETEGFEQIAAATTRYEELQTFYEGQGFSNLRVALLHGKMKPSEKERISAQLYAREIDILVTTPIVEVGLDLPAATYILIENAERFGLASLHQLRGRVGRAGQQGYCLLFSRSSAAQERLQYFSQETHGLKVAEYDLQHRGAGNIFGMEQHGFDQLRFASWTNIEMVTLARQLFDRVSQDPSWQPFITRLVPAADETPLAN